MATQTRGRTTAQQAVVQRALAAQDGFRSAQELFADLRAAGQSIGLSTVYRHLQAFAEQGVADVIHQPDGETTYRYCGEQTETSHHHHLVCRSCGRVEEIADKPVERWAEAVSQQHGFTEVDHTVEIFGVCAACTAAREEA